MAILPRAYFRDIYNSLNLILQNIMIEGGTEMSSTEKRYEKFMIIVPPAVSSAAIKPKAQMPIGAITVLAEAATEARVELLDAIAEGFLKKRENPEYPLERPFEVEGCELKLVGLSLQEIVERVRKSAADVIGVSCLTLADIPQTRKVTDAIKRKFPEMPIIIGGSEFLSYHPDFGHFQELPSVDYLGIGPGQRFIKNFLHHLNDPKSPRPKGVVFRDGYYELFPTPFNPNEFALPDYSLLPTVEVGSGRILDLYSATGMTHIGRHSMLFAGQEHMPYLPVVTSYGCPHNCKFCDLPDKHAQYTTENVMTMLEQAKALFGLNMLDVIDNNFAGTSPESRKRAFEILDAIKTLHLQIGFSNGLTMTAMERDDFELLHKIDEVGILKHIGMPCESGSDRVLRMANKPQTTQLVRRVLAYTAEKFPHWHKEGFFLGGFPALSPYHPAETPEELQQTVDLIDECLRENWLNQAAFFIVTPVSPVLRKIWRERNPGASYETCLYSAATDLWPYGRQLLEDTRKKVAELHAKYGKVQARYVED